LTNSTKAIELGAYIITGTPEHKYSDSFVGIECLAKNNPSSLKEIGSKRKSKSIIFWGTKS
jgi:hypothetical protein